MFFYSHAFLTSISQIMFSDFLPDKDAKQYSFNFLLLEKEIVFILFILLFSEVTVWKVFFLVFEIRRELLFYFYFFFYQATIFF